MLLLISTGECCLLLFYNKYSIIALKTTLQLYFKTFIEKINSGNLILFTNPSARAGYDTRSIFKRSLTGFNSEFSFS